MVRSTEESSDRNGYGLRWKSWVGLLVGFVVLFVLGFTILAIRSEMALRKNKYVLGFLSECDICNTKQLIERLWPYALGFFAAALAIETAIVFTIRKYAQRLILVFQVMNSVAVTVFALRMDWFYLYHL